MNRRRAGSKIEVRVVISRGLLAVRAGLLAVLQVVLDQRQPRVTVVRLALQQVFQLLGGFIDLAAVVQGYGEYKRVLRVGGVQAHSVA